ncbi:MAG: NAD-dependent epimerase/dehydratase family protein [Candidatus Marsarchaeota archaeon]|nr:NAD-dependent epimerase/dehydratase family protein [Candidatus Marsarchaeota archaeon]
MAQNRRKKAVRQTGKGKVAFITGGGGRVGRVLSTALLEKGYEVRAMSHEKDFVYSMPVGVVPWVADLTTNRKALDEACKGADIVFHLAAIVSEYKSPIRRLMEVNVGGTEKVLDACRRNGIGKFVFTSTVDVYGNSRNEVLTEDSRLKPTDKYGHSKMLAENKIERYDRDIDYTILRMSSVYGRGFENSYFKLFRAIREGKAYVIGSGNNKLSLVHVKDVVRGLVLAGESKKPGGVYNLSDGVAYTQQGLFNLVADLLKVERPTRHISPMVVKLVARSRGLNSDELRFLMSNRIIDIGKIKRELGFSPSIKIKEAGPELISDFVKSA